MKILVTGAAGFAGSSISKYLVSKGHMVTGLYRKRRPADIPGCVFLQQDIATKIDIEGQFDAIVHTACAHPKAENTFRILKRDNIDSMEWLLEFVLAQKFLPLSIYQQRIFMV